MVCAGTGTSLPVRFDGTSPRVWGNPAPAAFSLGCGWYIPARAGRPRLRTGKRHASRYLPARARGRGGTAMRRRPIRTSPGTSPRAGGSRCRQRREPAGRRFHPPPPPPPRAGQLPVGVWATVYKAVHPRACGVVLEQHVVPRILAGSSPCARQFIASLRFRGAAQVYSCACGAVLSCGLWLEFGYWTRSSCRLRPQPSPARAPDVRG